MRGEIILLILSLIAFVLLLYKALKRDWPY